MSPCFSMFFDKFYQLTTIKISQNVVCGSVARCQLASQHENFADLLSYTFLHSPSKNWTTFSVTVLMLLGVVGRKSVAKCTIHGLLDDKRPVTCIMLCLPAYL